MDLAILELPMALFTTLAPMAAGAFIGLAIAFLTTPFSKERLARIDRLTPIPVVIFAVAWVIAFVFFSSPQQETFLAQGLGVVPTPFMVLMSIVFTTLAVVYWIIAMTGKLPDRARGIFAVVLGIAALLFSLSLGTMYLGATVASWNSPLVPIALMGFSIAGGVPLGTLVITLAGGMPEARTTGFSGAALIVSFIGVVVSVFAVTAHMMFAQSLFSMYFAGELLPNSWIYLLISIIGFVAMLACMRSALMPRNRTSVGPMGMTAGTVAAMPQRGVAATAPTTARSAVTLLVVGNIAVIIAIVAARFMFYALHL